MALCSHYISAMSISYKGHLTAWNGVRTPWDTQNPLDGVLHSSVVYQIHGLLLHRPFVVQASFSRIPRRSAHTARTADMRILSEPSRGRMLSAFYQTTSCPRQRGSFLEVLRSIVDPSDRPCIFRPVDHPHFLLRRRMRLIQGGRRDAAVSTVVCSPAAELAEGNCSDR